MKSNKIILLLISAAFLNGFSRVNAQVDAKSKKARKDVQQANQELNEAHSDSASDYNIFKQKAEEQNVYNERKIAMLKEKNKMASFSNLQSLKYDLLGISLNGAFIFKL